MLNNFIIKDNNFILSFKNGFFEKIYFFVFVIIYLLNIYIEKDINTFSNYEIIQQTRIEANFNVDFTQKAIHGLVKTYFTALDDGERNHSIRYSCIKNKSVIDSDTGEELEFFLDDQYELDANGIPLKIYKEYNKNAQISI